MFVFNSKSLALLWGEAYREKGFGDWGEERLGQRFWGSQNHTWPASSTPSLETSERSTRESVWSQSGAGNKGDPRIWGGWGRARHSCKPRAARSSLPTFLPCSYVPHHPWFSTCIFITERTGHCNLVNYTRWARERRGGEWGPQVLSTYCNLAVWQVLCYQPILQLRRLGLSLGTWLGQCTPAREWGTVPNIIEACKCWSGTFPMPGLPHVPPWGKESVSCCCSGTRCLLQQEI